MNRAAFSAFFIKSTTLPMRSCVLNQANSVRDNIVSLEGSASKCVKFFNINIYQNGDIFEMAGKVHHRFKFGPHVKGHIDVAIITPDGTISETLSSPHDCWLGRRGRRMVREAPFYIKTSVSPPSGSMVRVEFHESQSTDQKPFSCGNNAKAC